MNPPPAARIGPDTPQPGELVQLIDGLYWARFPLPFALNHVNLWIVDGADGWAVIDTGYANDVSRDLWEQLLRGPLAGRPVTDLIATHYHPDHMGLAGWLVERTGAVLHMNETEWLTAKALSLDTSDASMAASLAYYRAAGMDETALEEMRADGPIYARRVSAIPQTFEGLAAGDRLRIGRFTFDVLTGHGHSPDQVMLHCPDAGVLIAADQILPRITPNIPVWPQQPNADPLAAFFRTLDRLDRIEPPAMILPSHDWPFADLIGRIASLRSHHAERLDATVAALEVSGKPIDVMHRLFPRAMDLHQTRFALGETLAHLHRLLTDGRVRREREGEHWVFAPK